MAIAYILDIKSGESYSLPDELLTGLNKNTFELELVRTILDRMDTKHYVTRCSISRFFNVVAYLFQVDWSDYGIITIDWGQDPMPDVAPKQSQPPSRSNVIQVATAVTGYMCNVDLAKYSDDVVNNIKRAVDAEVGQRKQKE